MHPAPPAVRRREPNQTADLVPMLGHVPITGPAQMLGHVLMLGPAQTLGHVLITGPQTPDQSIALVKKAPSELPNPNACKKCWRIQVSAHGVPVKSTFFTDEWP